MSGVEVAGSPFAWLHAMGTLGSIASYGNNLGLIVGPRVVGGRALADTQLHVTTRIAGHSEAAASAAALPGGIWRAIGFALEHAARQEQPLRAGQLISAGAITGVHPVGPGMACAADFGAFGVLHCRTVVMCG